MIEKSYCRKENIIVKRYTPAEVLAKGKTIITAHSGCEKTPPNSREHILAAIATGAEYIEIDVRYDGEQLYLSHDELLRYVDAGVMIQSNYGSLAGVYGTDVKVRVQRLIDEGLVSFLATDMHNMHYINTIGAWLSEGNTLMDF